jgi:hypothetical protein
VEVTEFANEPKNSRLDSMKVNWSQFFLSLYFKNKHMIWYLMKISY